MSFHERRDLKEDPFVLSEEVLADLPVGPMSTIEFIRDFRPTIGRVVQDFTQYPFCQQMKRFIPIRVVSRQSCMLHFM